MKVFLGLCVVIVFIGLFIVVPNPSSDFHDFYTATKLLLIGHSPYEWERFYNPVWLLLIITPFSVFPEQIAYRLFTIVALIFISFFVYKQKLPTIQTFLLLFVLWTVQIVSLNLEWLLLLGLIVNPIIGIWLVLLKPQLGIFLAIVLFIGMSWKQRVITLILLGIAILISILLGFHVPQLHEFIEWNFSPFPLFVPIGILSILISIYSKDKELALVSGLLVSPYWQFPSIIIGLPFLYKRDKVLFTLVAILILIITVSIMLINPSGTLGFRYEKV